jgi:hypothetical protein
MVWGASLKFGVSLSSGNPDLELSQVKAAVYVNTAAGYKAEPPLLTLTVVKLAARSYQVQITAAQSKTLEVGGSYRWYFLKAVAPLDTRHLLSGPWVVEAP